MKIKDRLEFKTKAQTFSLGSDATVAVAIKTMAEKNYGSVVIVDEKMHVKGIVTERDLLRRLLYNKLDPAKTPLSQIMTSDVKVGSVDDEVINWLRQMSNERFRHVPVVDANGKLITLMSQGDFVSYTWPDLLNHLRDKTRETIVNNTSQVPILIAGMMIYTIAILVILRFVLR